MAVRGGNTWVRTIDDLRKGALRMIANVVIAAEKVICSEIAPEATKRVVRVGCAERSEPDGVGVGVGRGGTLRTRGPACCVFLVHRRP